MFTTRGAVRQVAVAILLLFAPAIDVRAQGDDPAEKTVELKKGDRIIFFGDSLTALAVRDAKVPEGKGYVHLVRAALKDRGVEVDAVATGGHTVANLLQRVDRDVIAKKPTVVVIQIGVNDVSRGVAPELFRTQLTELIDKLQAGGAKVVLCSCTCRVEGYNPEDATDKKLDALAEVARSLAREKKLPLNDLRKAFIEYWKKHNPDNKRNGVLTYDGNHWNETGHQFVSERMLSKFK